MTDQELIKFLRTSTSAVFNKTTAHRIEELTLQLLAAHGQAADALDKLTKAMEVPRKIAPVVIHQVDPTAIREAALHEAADVAVIHYYAAGAAMRPEFMPKRFRDAILALIGETK